MPIRYREESGMKLAFFLRMAIMFQVMKMTNQMTTILLLLVISFGFLGLNTLSAANAKLDLRFRINDTAARDKVSRPKLIGLAVPGLDAIPTILDRNAVIDEVGALFRSIHLEIQKRFASAGNPASDLQIRAMVFIGYTAATYQEWIGRKFVGNEKELFELAEKPGEKRDFTEDELRASFLWPVTERPLTLLNNTTNSGSAVRNTQIRYKEPPRGFGGSGPSNANNLFHPTNSPPAK